MSLLNDFTTALLNAIQVPYCTGSVTLDPAASTLFYKAPDSEGAELVDFAHPTETKLEALSKACQAATFGRAQQDVLDESYRKALKMDASAFATQFAPLELGILHTIRQNLLRGQKAEKPIRVELYKLNVYGPGAFFKSHVDTPRSDKMFGSLVVILPTVHTGGSLLFRHNGREFSFDSARAVAVNAEGPRAAFVAFYSDVEHEVLPVDSGYRVTLTYNLYFGDVGSNDQASIVAPNPVNEHLKASFLALLKSPTFLAQGGLVGFSLSHQYPFNVESTRLSNVITFLKGADAAVLNMCNELSLEPTLKVVYRGRYEENEFCLMNDFADFDDGEYVEGGLMRYLEEAGGQIVYRIEKGPSSWGSKNAVPILWFKTGSTLNTFQSQYLAYGNEATIGYAYGELCLVVDIPPAASRGAQ
ncbi:hypothetical protein NLJ89_g8065 [Agrocybe chaxingu]|uniref:Fe2OG dioxygenase domain-containing protein n=1 Tax=Agrocybe chaxingu TaxID=84603 RepID=A0A9W8JW55_9AGAR|nr:hypothetical protein NLJ89_g8065 [Agrocybe chaxingu]